jgi:hypothetical protein
MLATMLLGAAAVARANPVINYVFYSHVQPLAGPLCYGLPIESCDELVQATRSTGPLEFDLFSLPGDPWLEWQDTYIHLEWPSDWLYVGAEVCGASGNSFDREGNTGILRMASLDGLPESSGLLGMAQVALVVTSPGWFRIVRVEGCEGSMWTSVRAGLECGECAWPCSWGWWADYAFPNLDPTVLELQAEAGKTAVGRIRVGVVYLEPGEDFSCTSGESWLSLDVQPLPPGEYQNYYEIMVTARADSLDPGTYEGWVEARRSQCSECARVVLAVVPPTPAQPESWGAVKSRFR